MAKQMLYKVCFDEQGEYVNEQGKRCNLLICNEVIFPAEDVEEGNIARYIPAPEEKGFYKFPSLENAMIGLGLSNFQEDK